MPIVVRPYEAADEGYWEVRSLTYGNGRMTPPEERVVRLARPFVADVHGSIQGTYVVLDMTCSCRGALLPCGGVAGVAVHPAERGSGVGSAMMRQAIRDMREQNIPIASLYPFREWYYRKFGYEVCGKRLEITCPAHRMPHVDSDLPMRCIRSSQYAEIDACHRAFVMARSGGTVRDEGLWTRIVSERNVIYAAGEPCEGYAIVQHAWEFFEAQTVQEIGWSTLRGYRAILGLMHRLSINKTSVTWHEPSDSPFVAAYLDQGVRVESRRPVMYRVTDVPAALALVKTEATGAFTFSVADDLIPENRGPWLASYSPTGVTLSKAATADLEFTVQTFTQALLGDPSLRDLVRNGLVEPRSEAALKAAEALLPACPVLCLDPF